MRGAQTDQPTTERRWGSGYAISRHGAWWKFLDAALSSVLPTEASSFDEALTVARAEVVKTGRHRTVYRLRSRDGDFFVKRYVRKPGPASWLQSWRRPKPELEERAAARLRECGVPTFETAGIGAVGPQAAHSDTLLVTRGISETVALDEFVVGELSTRSADEQAGLRSRIARLLGELVGRVHEGGVLHRDLHAGNFLIRVDEGLDVRMWLIDLHPVAVRRRVRWREAERNLALLQSFFATHATRSDRERFWEAYLAARGMSTGERGLARRVNAYCERAIYESWSKADSRWSRGNRRLVILERGARCLRAVAELERQRLPELLDGMDGFVKKGMTFDVSTAEGNPQRMRLQFRRFANGSARGAWENGHALLRRGIFVVRPWILLTTEAGGFIGTACDELEIPLLEYVAGLSIEERRTMAFRLRRVVERLIGSRFVAEGASLEDFVVDASGEPGLRLACCGRLTRGRGAAGCWESVLRAIDGLTEEPADNSDKRMPRHAA